ncbi:MAG: 3-oxoadipate enol-lactonase [Flavobacteriaceae bacterium]|nr:3-oxoadipate enol-lactonase [Flavobacteriaceae bacterium]
MKIQANNIQIHYQFIDNQKPETLVFSNSLGTNFTMWNKQIEALSQYFNILLSDTRGHGETEVTEGEYSAELLGNDVLELTKNLGIESFHFCGLSMGGLIGQWLAINGGERVKKVVLCNTAAKIGNDDGWNDRINLVKKEGLEPVAAGTPEKWFTDDFIENEKEQVEEIIKNFKKNSPEGYAANCAMVRDADFRNELKNIDKPVLIIAGSQDPVTTVEDGQWMQNEIKNSELVSIDARHLSAFEKPTEFNQALIQFLNR